MPQQSHNSVVHIGTGLWKGNSVCVRVRVCVCVCVKHCCARVCGTRALISVPWRGEDVQMFSKYFGITTTGSLGDILNIYCILLK